MSRVIFLVGESEHRDVWAVQWAQEGSDRVVLDVERVRECLNPRFVNEADGLAMCCVLNVLMNALKMGRHVCVVVRTRNRARFQRLERLARAWNGEVVWLLAESTETVRVCRLSDFSSPQSLGEGSP